MEHIKQFAYKSTSSSLKERKKLFEKLFEVLDNHLELNIPNSAFKGLSKMNYYLFPIYIDKLSKEYLIKLNNYLIEIDGESSLKTILTSLENHSNSLIGYPNRSSSTLSLYGQDIMNGLIRSIFAKNKIDILKDEINRIAKIYSNFILVGYSFQCGRYFDISYKKLKLILDQLPSICSNFMSSLLTDTGSAKNLLFLGYLLKYLSDSKNHLFFELKNSIMKIYVENMIESRLKIDFWLMQASNFFLKFVTEEDFKLQFLPELKRSLLRNPEIIIQRLELFLKNLDIDFDDIFSELISSLNSQLTSKDDTIQIETIKVIKVLTDHCRKDESLKTIIKSFFDILINNQAKFLTTNQKQSVMTAIGNSSENLFSSKQETSILILNCFKEYLKTETNEQMIINSFNQLDNLIKNLQIYNLSDEIILKIKEFFVNQLNIKSYTNNIRSNIFQVISSIFCTEKLRGYLVDFKSVCISSLEKVNSLVIANTLLSNEALSVSLILAFIANNLSSSKSNEFDILVLIDSKRNIFTNEKFLCSLNENGFSLFILLFERLMKIYSIKENIFEIRSWIVGYLYVLMNPEFNIRHKAQNVLKRILNWASYSFIVSLLELIENCLELFKTIKNSNEQEIVSNKNWPSKKSICELLLIISSVQNLKKSEIDDLTNKFVLISGIPYCFQTDKKLYEKCLIRLLKQNPIDKINFKELIKDQASNLINFTIGTENLDEKQLNSVEILCRLDYKNYLKLAVETAIVHLNNNLDRLQKVSYKEYQIMKTKPGDLYEKSLIENYLKQQRESSLQSNIKRENKAYTYKEQLADIELKKELDAKKGIKSEISMSIEKIKSQMSQKQRELLNTQLEKEEKIRIEMVNLDNSIKKSFQILIHAIKGNIDEFLFYILKITRLFILLIGSPLCQSYIINTFRELDLNNQITFAFVRLSSSSIDLDSCWTEEPLNQMIKRLIISINRERIFNPSKPALYYPFLKFVIMDYSSLEEEDYQKLIEIIENYCNNRYKQLDNHLRSYIPDFRSIVDNFPSAEFINLLLNIIIVSKDKNFNYNLISKTSEIIRNLILFTNRLLINSDINLTDSKIEFIKTYNSELNELTQGLFSPINSVRETCLNCISILINNRNLFLIEKPKFMSYDYIFNELKRGLIINCHDSSESNKLIAEKIWKEGSFQSDEQLCLDLIKDLVHFAENVRFSAADALAHLVEKKHQFLIDIVVKSLIQLYEKFNILNEPAKDKFGRLDSTKNIVDEYEKRIGIAHGLINLSKAIPKTNTDLIVIIFKFLVDQGMNDRNQIVRNKMLEASIESLNLHGKDNINSLLPLFEKFLQDAPKDASYDSVRQNVIISMGTLAKHLDKDDNKIAPIIDKLVQALQTPSQQVQEAVANCLPPLIESIKSKVPDYINQLLNTLFSAQTYGERRGAAYGLAGMVKGSGMISLKKQNVLQRLNEAIINRNETKQREGALIGYEMLCILLGKLFEPYSVEILPNLLICFGDSDESVRQAADDCAKVIMKNLTAPGVKMILPKLLERLGEDESWRTKCGSVELLGNMAHCAPKQLSSCLPSIVPKLIEILSDSHVKVQKAGAQALRHIGSVIKNPEILSITNILLEALQDPAVKTSKALQVLLETKFIHFIDAPSLALIIPVVKRAFQDRSTEIRKMAAQIMGNMYSLTDQKDLTPYLSSIIPGLKLSLLDPVPEVRAVSSKALGAMIKVIGENDLSLIISWLMEKLVSEISSVDRSGAAQGLSEVFGALGVGKLEKSMPDIIERAIQNDLSPFIRDGYLMMFIYLPLTFGDSFIPYIGLIIQPILNALADDSEFLRDTAIKAGQRIVNMYADCAINLFLPELEKGLFDLNWRIRFSSVQLLGDLLYKISGVIGKMTTESAHEDDNFGTEKGSIAIINALGIERRNIIYSGLYMGRSDTSLQVRQAALHIWKVIVSNTPKTLKEILSTLFHILLNCLSSSNGDKRQIAASTLVDIVKKLGERILPDIIPILEKGLNTECSDQRQGVCIALSEIMSNISRDNLLIFSDNLIPTVRKALMDRSPEVRSNAAKTFDNLHSMIGIKALEEVCLNLYGELKSSDSEHSERALDALKQIMLIKSRAILPFLIPHLTAPPINMNALCKLCSATNTEVLSKHLNRVLISLLQALSTTYKTDLDSSNNSKHFEWVNECEQLLLSIHDPDGVKTLISELIQNSINPDKNIEMRLAALEMLSWFCSKTSADFSEYNDELIKSLFSLLSDTNQLILEKTWLCIYQIVQRLNGTALTLRLPVLRQSLRSMSKFNFQNINQIYNLNFQALNSVNLPGFCLPRKGISCILPIFKEGLLNGSSDIKEQSAQILCECIKLSDGESLKSSVMAITGPLIRVLGERYSSGVKSAILDAIYLLLLKVNITLKPFLPQLQPTFIKNLSDNDRIVRLKSGYALANLLEMSQKKDSVLIDILNLTKNSTELQFKETYLNTVRLCIISIGSKLSQEINQQIFEILKDEEYFYSKELSIRSVSAGILGSLLNFLNDNKYLTFFNDLIDYDKYSSKQWIFLQSNCMCISSTFQFFNPKCLRFDENLFKFLKKCSQSENIHICMSSIRAICFIFNFNLKNEIKFDTILTNALARCINHNSNEIKLLSVQIISFICAINEKPFDSEVIKIFVPMLINGTREKASFIRSASEIALIKMLKLNTNKSFYKEAKNLLGTMKDSFEDCIETLNKESINNQMININEFKIDETLLKLD